MFRTQGHLFIVLLCLFHLMLSVVNHPGRYDTDDRIYYEEAKNLAEGNWELSQSPKNHRFALLLPAAGMIRIFGDSPYATLALPLLFSLGSILLLYAVLLKYGSLRLALTGAGLLALCPDQVIYSAVLFPDVLNAFFFLLIPLLLYRGVLREKGFLYGCAAGLLFLPALFVRESILFLFPACLVLFLFSLPEKNSLKLFGGFFLSAAISLGAWAGLFAFLSGDPGFVYNSVEQEYSARCASTDELALLDRLLFNIPGMFFRSLSFLPLLAFALPLLLSLLAKRKPVKDMSMWWSIVFVTTQLTFWFGTTSFSRYALLLPLERLWLPLVPFLCILSAYSLEGELSADGLKFRRRALFFFLVLAMVFSLYYIGLQRFIFYLFVLVSLEVSWYGVQEMGQKKKWETALCLAPFILLSLYFTWKNSVLLAGFQE